VAHSLIVLTLELHDTLAIYTPHLEDSFLNITIPDPNQQVVDVTAAYVSAVTAELARCTEEYKARLELCQRTANEIVNLWAQLGSESSSSSLSISSSSSSSSLSSMQFDPQSDFDRLILENHNKAPEKIGLKQEILNQLAAKRDELLEEKQRRQSKLNTLRAAIEPMWQKLGKDKKECDTFLRRNRGFSERVIAAVWIKLTFQLTLQFEKELAHLTELKRENMHVFVDAARSNLQHLWDELFFSEEQMSEFAPAFTGSFGRKLPNMIDIFTDASLAAHEYEVKRLEGLVNSRQTALTLVKKHMDLMAEKQHLEETSKDPSRLTQRGAQAAGRLLQEEKIRKKLNKELPKVTVS
jgi:Ase1/PRC1/MAP65 family protein